VKQLGGWHRCREASDSLRGESVRTLESRDSSRVAAPFIPWDREVIGRLLESLQRHRVKLFRYTGVSVVVVVITQSLLILASAGFRWSGVASNVFAVSLAAIPAFWLNRRFVWARVGEHSVVREVVPFWVYSVMGLVLSTVVVALADRWWGTTFAVAAANLAGFLVLWVGKFLFLEKCLFRATESTAEVAAA
jgi:putative flippase GtrA